VKKCSRCKALKAFELFYKNAKMKDGLNTFCKICHMEDRKVRRVRLRAIPDRVEAERKYKKEYRQRTVEQRRAYMLDWRSNNSAYVTSYRAKRAELNREYNKNYSAANRASILAKCRARQAAQLQRTPRWVGPEELWLIKEAYSVALQRSQITGFKWHVDHIVPLQGKLVSGLHTPNNIQVIPATLNCSKNNKFEV